MSARPRRRSEDRAAATRAARATRATRVDTIVLAVVALVVRLPFLRFHDLVTYDGTSYLSEAQALQQFDKIPGAFPIGYPVAAALVQLVARDWVFAGQLVSLLAGVGSTILIHRLVAERGGRLPALAAAAVLTFNPLFIRLTLQTMSESLYIFLVLLGLVMATRRRLVAAGFALGAATATRPEGIAILGVIALFHLRAPRRLAQLVLPFALVFAVNVAALSVSQGQWMLLSKSSWLGSATRDWVDAERAIDYELPPDVVVDEPDTGAEPAPDIGTDYMRTMPRELALLARHTWPAVLLLALWGIWRTGWHVFLAPLATLFVFTLFTKRQEDRYILPYVPFLILYAALGAAALRKPLLRYGALGVMGACAAGLIVVERPQLTAPEETGLESLRDAGRAMKDVMEPDDRVADRKPHMAFYAGARYVEIPVAPYDDTIAALAADGVEWLSLHQNTIHPLRPALRPLMYSRAVINGELRYQQAFYEPAGEMVFQLSRNRDPLEWTQLTAATKADIMPAWSPDGERIAFRRQRDDGTVSLMVASRRNRVRGWSEDNIELVDVAPLDDGRDPLAWSPDGERIAFARRNTGERTDFDLYAVDVFSRAETRLVSSPLDDRSPSWPAADRIVFARETTSRSDVWAYDPASGREDALSESGGSLYPVADASGRWVAWSAQSGGVHVMSLESGAVNRLPVPKGIVYAPAWSPDGMTIAVAANDWGSYDIYLLRPDGSNVLLLTKSVAGEASPAWSPDGSAMAVVSNRGGTFSLWLLTGLEPYLERMETRVQMNVFAPLTERTNP